MISTFPNDFHDPPLINEIANVNSVLVEFIRNRLKFNRNWLKLIPFDISNGMNLNRNPMCFIRFWFKQNQFAVKNSKWLISVKVIIETHREIINKNMSKKGTVTEASLKEVSGLLRDKATLMYALAECGWLIRLLPSTWVHVVGGLLTRNPCWHQKTLDDEWGQVPGVHPTFPGDQCWEVVGTTEDSQVFGFVFPRHLCFRKRCAWPNLLFNSCLIRSWEASIQNDLQYFGGMCWSYGNRPKWPRARFKLKRMCWKC